MALTKCKECAAVVAVSALQCPQCGVLAPGYSDAQIRKATGSFIVGEMRFALWLAILLGLLLRFAVPAMFPNSILNQPAVGIGGWFILLGSLVLIFFEAVLYVRRKLVRN